MKVLYKCETCEEIFNSYSEYLHHEQEEKGISDINISKIARKTIKSKLLQKAIKTTEDYIYHILLPNIESVAKTTGSNEFIFCATELNSCLDSRLDENFFFDMSIFNKIIKSLGFSYCEIYYNEDRQKCIMIAWNNHLYD